MAMMCERKKRAGIVVGRLDCVRWRFACVLALVAVGCSDICLRVAVSRSGARPAGAGGVQRRRAASAPPASSPRAPVLGGKQNRCRDSLFLRKIIVQSSPTAVDCPTVPTPLSRHVGCGGLRPGRVAADFPSRLTLQEDDRAGRGGSTKRCSLTRGAASAPKLGKSVDANASKAVIDHASVCDEMRPSSSIS